MNIAAIVLILAFTGPFGTYSEFTLSQRLLFWTVAILGGGLFIHAAVMVALAPDWSSMRIRLLAVAVGDALGAVPASAVVLTAYTFLSGDQFSPSIYPAVWSNVALIGLGVALIQFRTEIRGASDQAAPAPPSESVAAPAPTPEAHEARAPLLERLPTQFAGARVMSFSMQDHYVEVSTDRGRHLLLMRFGDAIDLLGDLPGVRTHRSHWAATEAMVELKKSGRKHLLQLTNGTQLPVSGTYLEDVKRCLKEKSAA